MGLPIEVVIPGFALFCAIVAIAVKKWADAGEGAEDGASSSAH